MLEQEVASIIKFTLDSAGNPAPYYEEIKENFILPCVYFPSPEIDTDGETLLTYRMRYMLFIKFFHTTTTGAYTMAQTVLDAMKKARNLIPIIDTEGKDTGEKLRIQDPSIKKIDSGVYRLIVEWDSRRPYVFDEATYAQEFYFNGWLNAPQYQQPTIPDTDTETQTDDNTDADTETETETNTN